MTPASIAPGLVPMQSPSSAVKPKLLSTLFAFRMAHRLAPLPKCATTTRPFAISGAVCGSIHRLQPTRQLVERVTAIADLVGFTIDKDLPFSVLRVDPWRSPDSFDLAPRFQTPIPFRPCEYTELQAR